MFKEHNLQEFTFRICISCRLTAEERFHVLAKWLGPYRRTTVCGYTAWWKFWWRYGRCTIVRGVLLVVLLLMGS